MGISIPGFFKTIQTEATMPDAKSNFSYKICKHITILYNHSVYKKMLYFSHRFQFTYLK